MRFVVFDVVCQWCILYFVLLIGLVMHWFDLVAMVSWDWFASLFSLFTMFQIQYFSLVLSIMLGVGLVWKYDER